MSVLCMVKLFGWETKMLNQYLIYIVPVVAVTATLATYVPSADTDEDALTDDNNGHLNQVIGIYNAAFTWTEDDTEAFLTRDVDDGSAVVSEAGIVSSSGASHKKLRPHESSSQSFADNATDSAPKTSNGPGSWENLPRQKSVAYAAQESWVLDETIWTHNIAPALPAASFVVTMKDGCVAKQEMKHTLTIASSASFSPLTSSSTGEVHLAQVETVIEGREQVQDDSIPMSMERENLLSRKRSKSVIQTLPNGNPRSFPHDILHHGPPGWGAS
ncbi:hypothetical protein F5051DRAFT_506989 [Lentinula edodes]|nr:hypothetical protein F5051DRAFT_506989 [Lentinula edodes]